MPRCGAESRQSMNTWAVVLAVAAGGARAVTRESWDRPLGSTCARREIDCQAAITWLVGDKQRMNWAPGGGWFHLRLGGNFEICGVER